MNIIKKFIAFIMAMLILVLILPSMSILAVSDNNRFAVANELLCGLGFDDVSAISSENIPRDTFVSLASKNSYYDGIDKENLPMAGVYADTNYWFHPGNNITMRDALTLCIKLLGINVNQENNTEIQIIANSLKLCNGIGTDFDSVLNYEKAYILVFNYITADLSGYKNQYPFMGTSILEDKYEIYEVRGVVDAAGVYSLGENSVKGDFISIGGELYLCSRYNEEVFGKRVTAYIRKDDVSDKVVALIPDNRTQMLELYAKNCAEYNNFSYTYTDTSSGIKTVKISPKADIFINGAAYDFSKSLKEIDYDKITIINNGIYQNAADIVLIERAETVKITAFNKSINTFYSYGKSYVLDDETKIADDSGKAISCEDISVGDIVSFYAPDGGNVWKCIKLTQSVRGNISGVSTGEVSVDKNIYSSTVQVSEKAAELIGKNVILVLDLYGDAVYISDEVSTNGMVGVMVAADFSPDTFGFKLMFKLYTENDVYEVFETVERPIINGITYTELKKAYEAIPTKGDSVKQTIVRYELDNFGKIKAIDFPSDIIMDKTHGAQIYKTGEDNMSNRSYITYSKWSEYWGENVFITPNTKVFRIPKQGDDGSIVDDENYFSVFTASSATSGTNYTATSKGYSIDSNNKVSDYVIMEYDAGQSSATMGVNADTRLFMVGEVVKTFDIDGLVVEAISIYNKNYPAGKRIYGKSETYFTDAGIAAGDLVRINFLSATNVVRAVELVYKKGSKTLTDGKYLFSGEGGGAGKVSEIRLCNVYKNWNPIVDLVYPDVNLEKVTNGDIKPVKASLYTIFRYNEKSGKVEVATVDELLSYDNVGDNCTQVVFDDRWLDPFSIFIIKQ